MSCAIFSTSFVASFSPCALTYGGVVGTVRSSSSFIWSLYYSKACTIFLMFSSEDTPSDSTLFGMVWNIVLIFFSISSNLCCSIFFACPSWLIASFSVIFSSCVIYKFVASDISLDGISCATLIFNL
jgi:hypothetical protein